VDEAQLVDYPINTRRQEGHKRVVVLVRRCPVAHIDGPDLTAFLSVVNGVHDFNEKEMATLSKAAQEVKEVVQSANDRQQKRMRAGLGN
jgi:hypothetical protein